MNNLQKIRKLRGLSQNGLVIRSGVSRSLITKYESGERNINKASVDTVYKLAKALNCSMEDIIDLLDSYTIEK
jgi:transcriptional regulator with XRE-family HTH domain